MARNSESNSNLLILPTPGGEAVGRASPDAATAGRSRLLTVVILVYFAIVFCLITITSFVQKSPTADEPAYLFSGYSYLKWGDFRANPEHPPLVKVWAALPLLAFDVKEPRPSPDWDAIPASPFGGATANLARQMLFADNDAGTLFFYAKLQMIVLSIVLGIFVYLWSRELFGLEAALASLFLYALDPNILAHSQVVGLDLPPAAFFFIGTYFFWRALKELTWSNLLLTSAFFGLAAITKYSFLAILLSWGILGLVKIFSPEPQPCTLRGRRAVSSRWGKAALFTAIILSALAAAYFCLWAAYGFRFDAIPGGGHTLPIGQMMPESRLVQTFVSFIAQHRLLPEASIYGLLYTSKYLSRAGYLFGRISSNGFWLYFPVAFAVKTPLPTLILLIAAAVALIFRREERRRTLFLLVPMVVYFSLAVAAGANIGLRHILPIYPFLFVLVSGTAAELWQGRSRTLRQSQGDRVIKRGGLGILAVWYLWSCAAIYPHYLAYFNELAGGAKNGHKVLIDSNLDWGQDLKGLKRWMDAHEVKRIQLLYFGNADPEYYGIDAVYLPGSWFAHRPRSQSAEPEYLAVSATFLYGSEIHLLPQAAESIKPFRTREPVATIGYSIYIFTLG